MQPIAFSSWSVYRLSEVAFSVSGRNLSALALLFFLCPSFDMVGITAAHTPFMFMTSISFGKWPGIAARKIVLGWVVRQGASHGHE